MGKDTKIEWTDSTINPTSGCLGCELYRPDANGEDATATCYAREVHVNRLAKSYPELYAPRFDVVHTIPGRMLQAANWADLAGTDRKDKPWMNGRPRHIFVGDMGDVFSAGVSMEFLKSEVIKAIESKNGRRHIWQLLTKRPERLAELSEELGGLPDNVVAMTTVTNQRSADVRIPLLLRVKAKRRGLSIEPMRAAVDIPIGKVMTGFPRHITSSGHAVGAPLAIHWLICGGESGHRAQPMHPDWARSIRDQCAVAGVAFFFKQWGEWLASGQQVNDTRALPNELHASAWHNFPEGGRAVRVGKSYAGRLLDGVEHNGMPEVDSV